MPKTKPAIYMDNCKSLELRKERKGLKEIGPYSNGGIFKQLILLMVLAKY